MATAYLSLGTNLGDRRTNLTRALAAIATIVRIDRASSVYETEPVGHREQPDFWNMAIRVQTDLEPAALLAQLQQIEQNVGRTPTFRYGPRVLDIDLLLYDDRIIRGTTLQVPHPRMHERAFVLRPLAELDASLRDPVTGLRFADRLQDPRGRERVEPVLSGSELLPMTAPGGAGG